MRAQIRQLAKCELHDHLDGVPRINTIINIAQREGIKLPSMNPKKLWDRVRFKRGYDLKQCLASFGITTAVMQSAYALERIAYEHCEDLAADNVTYAEVRYCPLLHTQAGLSLDRVVKSTLRGLRHGKRDFGVDTRLIFCGIREFPAQDNLQLVELAARYKDQGVVAIDLAGNEYDFPAKLHVELFKRAKQAGLYLTAHAGEMRRMNNPSEIQHAITQGLENLRTLVYECNVDRIGHAVTLAHDKELMKEVRDRGITLEISLTSNLLTGAITQYAQHPLKKFYDFGIKTVLCTDDAMMCNTTLTGEMVKANKHFKFSFKDLEKMNQYAFDARFL